jgi:type I restriction enzyme M protein
MAIKKSELYSSLWRSCDELRGGMDASQYKDYVLVLLFVKYVSDKYAANPDAVIEVPEGGGFKDLVALKGKPDIGDKMNQVIRKLIDTNELSISFADFNDPEKLGKGKEMVDRLTNLITIFEDAFDFSRNRAEGDDILGDAYEYLMRHFATESGKSKGQFYTPSEVSRVMAKVIGISQATSQSQTIYDPTCGSGSLLIKASDESERGITIYGQEMDNATASLAKMNMILHDHPTAIIWQDNTLASPHFKDDHGNLKTFDFAVSNPPFSTKAWSNGFNPYEDEYKRFEDGVPPAKNGDYAFLLHLIRSLKSKGKGAIILPHGVLFRGNVEADIRRELIKRGYIKGVISLPTNLFYGTGIPACIIVIDKENADSRRGIFMIDASRGYVKDGNKNRLRHEDMHKIVDVFLNQLEIKKYSRMVPLSEIADSKNDYNLNIPRYINSQEPEDIQDIEAHLLGGIPNRDVDALQDYWTVCPSLKGELFCESKRAGYSELKIGQGEVRNAIYTHHEFAAYREEVDALFNQWRKRNTPILKGLEIGAKPKELIHQISEDILRTFVGVRLIDKYDLYQHLMSYWTETMQDDGYIIASDGWEVGGKLRLILQEKLNREKPDIEIGKKRYKSDLIPPQLVIDRYFPAEKSALELLQAEQESVTGRREEMEEEHSGEEGVLEGVKNEKGRITKANVQGRAMKLRKIILNSSTISFEQKRLAKAVTKEFAKVDWQKGQKDEAELFAELDVLHDYLLLLDEESEAKSKVREAKAELDQKVFDKYRELSEAEIKTLVVDDKWMVTLDDAVKSEMERISQKLTQRVKILAARYASPLPKLDSEVEGLAAKVKAHLNKMGYVWNYKKAIN